MITKRLIATVTSGAIFGLICVVVALLRFKAEIPTYMLISLWFNRVLMGIVIGAPWDKVSLQKSLLRGAILGITVSFAYFSSTGFTDLIAFLPGIVQGMIFEFIAYWATGRLKKQQ